MQLAARQLAADLNKGLRPLYVLHGDEALLMQEAVDAIRAAARAGGEVERNVFAVSGARFDWGAVLAASGSMSLFGARQIVEIRIPTGRPGKEGATALQRIAEAAEGGSDCITIIQLPRPDKAMRDSVWFKALAAGGCVIAIESVERAALPQWIAQRLAAQGQRVPAGEEGERALAFFADRVEGNLLAAHQEVLKLGLLHPPGEISFAAIEAAVLDVAHYDTFHLSAAILGGQRQKVQRMIDSLRAAGTPEVRVHWAIADDIGAIARVQAALARGAPMPVALREARIWGERERLIARAVPRVKGARLAALLAAAHQVDGICKGLPAEGWPADPWLALQRLAQSLCGLCAAA